MEECFLGQEVLKRFDRYTLLDLIAQGGMAEIFRARPASNADGANRVVVLKRILAAHARNADFVKMFKAETKVMMGLSHPNIVQLYDFGEFEGQPYIAMELVDGKNFRPFISRYAEQKRSLPPEFCVYVVQQVAEGLAYAHTYRDRISGEPLNLVHRDISPQNILVSYEGNIKVIDFGIAKAHNVGGDSTRVGIIKGKPSYLSPEQIAGEVLDGRSDVFSLGIVLWESLTGKKLFSPGAGENDYAVLKQIEAADAHVRAPSKVIPTLPATLDPIVMKALTRDRNKRYKSAEEFSAALRRWLVTVAPEYSARDASKIARELFKQDIVEDRKTLVALLDKANRVPQPKVKGGKNATLGSQASSGAAVREEDTSAVSQVHLENVKSTPGSLAVRTELKKMMVREQAKQKTAMFTSQGTLSQSTTLPPARSSGFPIRLLLTLLIAAAVGGPQVFPDYFPPAFHWTHWLKPQNRTAASTRNAAGSGLVQLRIDVTPGPGVTRIYLDGKLLDSKNPVGQVRLGDSYEVVVDRDRYPRLEHHGVVTLDQVSGSNEANLKLVLRPPVSGTVSLSSSPTATVDVYSVDDGTLVMTIPHTPAEDIVLPAGTYKFTFRNENLGSTQQRVETIRKDQHVDIKNVDMSPN